jgi:hypothetical protein
MDPKAIQSLERGFWYRLGAGVLVGVVVAVAVAFLVVPAEPFLPALMGALAVLFLGFTATSLAVDARVEAAGQALAAVGWVVLGAGSAVEWTAFGLADAVGVTDPIFWAGLGLVFVGGLVGFWADHRQNARATNG